MRYFLLASTCCFALATAASAETSVTTKQTAPIRTSTINAGARDDIKISSTGSVELTAGGGAVTIRDQIGSEVGAEQYQGNWALSVRASLRVGL